MNTHTRTRSGRDMGGIHQLGSPNSSPNKANNGANIGNKYTNNTTSSPNKDTDKGAFDTREARVLAIIPPSDSVTPCVFTVHSSPLGGHAELRSMAEGNEGKLLERFDLGRPDLRVTAADAKLALYV